MTLSTPGGIDYALSEGVERRTLPNGLTILAKSVSFSPVVALVAHFKIGYLHEADDQLGLAHVLEHMFFKGSRNHPGHDTIPKRIRGVGGILNAATTYDRTVYYFVLPSMHFRDAFHVMADAIVHPEIDPGMLRREIEVIIREIERKKDQPGIMATEMCYAHAFARHRLRRWRMGDPEHLRTVTAAQLRDLHGRFNRPENLILSIVGDIAPQEVFETVEGCPSLCAEYPSVPPVDTGPPEPPQNAPRIGRQEADTHQARLHFLFKVPGVGDPSHAALSAMAFALGGGRLGRLHRSLRYERGLVDNVSATVAAYHDVGLFHVRAAVAPERVDEARDAILDQVNALRCSGITGDELRMARNRTTAQQLFRLQDVRHQAVSLAYHEAYGGYERADEAMRAILDLRVKAVRETARTYLVPERLTHYTQSPKEQPVSGGDAEALRRALTHPAPTTARVRPPPAPRPLPHLRRPLPGSTGHRRGCFPLTLGQSCIVLEDPSLPTATLHLCFPGGRALEHADEAGIGPMSVRIAREGGSTALAHDRFHRALDGIGARMEIAAGPEATWITIHAPTRLFHRAIDVTGGVLREPAFPRHLLDTEKARILRKVRQRVEKPALMASLLFRHLAFGRESPHGRGSDGRAECIDAFEIDALRAWFQRMRKAAPCLAVAGGDIDGLRLHTVLDKTLKGILLDEENGEAHEGEVQRGKESRSASFYRRPPFEVFRERAETFDVGADISEGQGGTLLASACLRTHQTALVLGLPIPSACSSERFGIALLIETLRGMGGRLSAEFRGRQSLSYSVGAYDLGLRSDNFLIAYLACSPNDEENARRTLFKVLEDVRRRPPSSEEIERARQALLGARAIRLQSPGARAAAVAGTLLKGLSLDDFDAVPEHLQAVTREEVASLATRYLHPERGILAVARGRS